jgi:hypothetical protein
VFALDISHSFFYKKCCFEINQRNAASWISVCYIHSMIHQFNFNQILKMNFEKLINIIVRNLNVLELTFMTANEKTSSKEDIKILHNKC